MQIIAISGKLCSGKSALAARIVKADPHYVVCSLAAPLKADITKLTGADIAANKAIMRPLLQTYGSVMRQLYGADVWVDRLVRDAREAGHEYIVVDDVRYLNEMQRLFNAAEVGRFYTIRLEITPAEQALRYKALYGAEPDPDALAHHSETSLDGLSKLTRRSIWNLVIDSALPPQEIERAALLGLQQRQMVRLAAWTNP